MEFENKSKNSLLIEKSNEGFSSMIYFRVPFCVNLSEEKSFRKI